MPPTLFTCLSKDVLDSIWRHYLGKHSISIALLRCTTRAARTALMHYDPLVSSNATDGCNLAVIESVLPPICDESIDWRHWLNLFCAAAARGDLSDVMRLLGMRAFVWTMRKLCDNTVGLLASAPTLRAINRAFTDIHTKAVASQDWKTWLSIYHTVDCLMLRNWLIAKCFIDRHALDGQLLELSENCLRDASKRESLHWVGVFDLLSVVGRVIGQRGSVDDLSLAATSVSGNESLSSRLYQGCFDAAILDGRADKFLARYESTPFFVNAIPLALTCNNTKLLEIALEKHYDLGEDVDSIVVYAIESGNATACRLLLKETSIALPPAPTIKFTTMFAMALCRSVEDARFFLEAYPNIIETRAIFGAKLRQCVLPKLTDTVDPTYQLCQATWTSLLQRLALKDEPNSVASMIAFSVEGAALDKERMLFFFETFATASPANRQPIAQFMLRSLVRYSSFTEALADELLNLIVFDGPDARAKYGKKLAWWSLLDSAFQWTRFHFPESRMTAEEVTKKFESAVGPPAVGREVRAQFASSISNVSNSERRWMRWLGSGMNLLPFLSEYPGYVTCLPPYVIAIILRQHADESLTATLSDGALRKVARHLFEEGRKQLFCEFYQRTFRPNEHVVAELRDAMRTSLGIDLSPPDQSSTFLALTNILRAEPTGSGEAASPSETAYPDTKNNRVRAWLLQTDPQLYVMNQ